MGAEIVSLVVNNDTLSAHARVSFNEACAAVDNPLAIVVVVIGRDDYSVRSVSDTRQIKDIDMYGRAVAIVERQRSQCLE
jgi:hypothetical protein